MDKIWDRKSFRKSEVIGHCGGMKKMNDHVEQTKRKKRIYVSTWNACSLQC